MNNYLIGILSKKPKNKKRKDEHEKNINDKIDNNEKISYLLKKYNEHLPVYIQKLKNSKLPNLEKKKYLLPKQFEISKVIFLIRKFLRLDSTESLYIFVSESQILPSQNALLVELFDKYKTEKGILQIFYDKEKTFG